MVDAMNGDELAGIGRGKDHSFKGKEIFLREEDEGGGEDRVVKWGGVAAAQDKATRRLGKNERMAS